VNTAEVWSPDEPSREEPGEVLSVARDAVEVRRNGGLAALLGAGASTVAIAFLARAVRTGSVLDWTMVVVLGLLAAAWLRALVDARTPLLVADNQGVRLRLGRTWRGLPWGALAEIEHRPRRGLFRDGRLVLSPRNRTRALAELDASGKRQALLAARMYGSPFAVPLGLTTRISGAGSDLTAALRQLADASTSVVEIAPPAPAETEDEAASASDEADGPTGAPGLLGGLRRAIELPARVRDGLATHGPAALLRDPRPLVARAIGSVAARISHPNVDDTVDDELAPGAEGGVEGEVVDGAAPTTEADAETDVETEPEVDSPEDTGPIVVKPLVASATPAPLREPRAGRRTEVTRDVVRQPEEWELEGAADRPVGRELRKPGSVNLVEDNTAWGDRVRPIARAGDAVAPLVIDGFGVEPADDPVVGPELAAARTRLGLTVDQLADRTRIRPHVIESIEVDDFEPCGGDFYARGHLRTLARVLGLNAAPLLETYDDRYSDAPINPRRVFEAELATGLGGGIRSVRGGPNWSVLVGVVMAVVLAWSVARLVMDQPTELAVPDVNLNGSQGPAQDTPSAGPTVPVTLSALLSVHVVIHDNLGKVIYAGDLEAGTEKTFEALTLPVWVKTSDGAGLVAIVNGHDRGVLGEPGIPTEVVLRAHRHRGR
jgi:hypothetical protein